MTQFKRSSPTNGVGSERDPSSRWSSRAVSRTTRGRTWSLSGTRGMHSVSAVSTRCARFDISRISSALSQSSAPSIADSRSSAAIHEMDRTATASVSACSRAAKFAGRKVEVGILSNAHLASDHTRRVSSSAAASTPITTPSASSTETSKRATRGRI